MSLLHIYLFGRFQVRSGQQLLAGFDARKVQELFCYLLLFQDHPHPREALADLFWGDIPTDRPNRCLRRALWQLRTALHTQAEPLCDCLLLVEPNWVQINPEADLWLDVAEFEEAFHGVQSLQGNELDAQSIQSLQSAVGLYRGGLQESWYQDWYLYERERFQHMYLVMLDKLMDHCEAHRNYEAGLAYGTLVLGCERARERTHRRQMRLYHLAGDRTAALRQYKRCVRALDEELGVGPARRTVELYQQIRIDPSSGPTLVSSSLDEAPQTATSPLPGVLGLLRQLQAILTGVQHQIDQDIRAVESAIDSRDQPEHLR